MKEEKIIFLDRDGVICKEKDLLTNKNELELIHKSAKAIHLLNKKNYKVIVVTNQPVIARGLCTLEELFEINEHLKLLLAKENAYISKIYYCPHHPQIGSNLKYIKECNCRKPNPGMILQAKKDFKINNLENCFMIGDKISDIKAGSSAGCKTILVKTGYGGKEKWKDSTPDYIVKNLYEAVKSIVIK